MYADERDLYRKLRPARALLGTMLLALATTAGAMDTDGYALAIYSDAPGGRAILQRDFDAAIAAARAQEHRPGDRIGARTNLCAALLAKMSAARTQSDGGAAAACEDALHAARAGGGSELALAYLNRGVLQALAGDATAAAADFRRAIQLYPGLESAQSNLVQVERQQLAHR